MSVTVRYAVRRRPYEARSSDGISRFDRPLHGLLFPPTHQLPSPFPHLRLTIMVLCTPYASKNRLFYNNNNG